MANKNNFKGVKRVPTKFHSYEEGGMNTHIYTLHTWVFHLVQLYCCICNNNDNKAVSKTGPRGKNSINND